MANIYNLQDKALWSTSPEEVVDLGEEGGTRVHLVLEKTGGGSVTIEGSTEREGKWDYTWNVTIPASGHFRTRLPLDVPRFIRLGASDGTKLSVRG